MGDQRIFEKLNIALGVILVDHPFIHTSRIIKNKGANIFFCMYDLEYLDCFEECIDDSTPIAWLMHGGMEDRSNKITDKVYDIIVPSSISDYRISEKEILQLEEGVLKNFATNLYEKGLQNYNIPLYTYFKEGLKSMGIEVEKLRNNEIFLKGFSSIYVKVDRTLRERFRYEVLKELLNGGFNIQHYGSLNDREFLKNKNFISKGPIDYNQLLKEIKKSKLLLHDTPYFQNGSHERIFTSMLNNTLVLSNNNNYCSNEYIDGENIVFYNVNNLDTLIEKAQFYLSNEDERKRIENNAYKLTKKLNTWKNRAEEILGIYNGFILQKYKEN